MTSESRHLMELMAVPSEPFGSYTQAKDVVNNRCMTTFQKSHFEEVIKTD